MSHAAESMVVSTTYEDFIAAKRVEAPARGFDVEPDEISPIAYMHQRAVIRWAVRKGCCGIFARFGLGKCVMQLEAGRLITKHRGGAGLLVAPLGVRGEFAHDAAMLGIDLPFVQSDAECPTKDGQLYVTNYESVRDGKIDATRFTFVSLDEADVLRGFGSTKVFREFMATIAGDDRRDRSNRVKSDGVPFRMVATATPAPNEYLELLAYAAFLGVMDVGAAKTRFFKRNSEKADALTLHPHKVAEFWKWVASWAVFLEKPSDIDPSFSDAGYELPKLHVHWHELPTNHANAGSERDGQMRLVRDSALGIVDASREKRDSLDARIAKTMEIILEERGDPACAMDGPLPHAESGLPDQVVVWCDLNDEQDAIERGLAAESISCSSLRGSMSDLDERLALIGAWKGKETSVFLSKPSMYGSGVNLQQSHSMVFSGISFKAKDVIQAVHRIHRFLQKHECHAHMIYTEAEREVRRTLERKWQQHDELVAQMTAIVREHGLGRSALDRSLERASAVERIEVKGERFTLVNNCAVLETRRMPANSVDLILTSIPFSMQYEYSPSYLDFGHSDTNEHFWRQMDFLIPELLRVLKPGRVAEIHVKDRIVPGGMEGLGFQTVYPFHCDAIWRFAQHGFAYIGMRTIVTDVVRENNQTYRLGYTEQCKDGSRMGVGMPEYLLRFRKPPTDNSNGYADTPVTKSKEKYSLGRWQLDAHGFMRSSGDRLLSVDDLAGMTHAQIYQRFRDHSRRNVYDFDEHVKLQDGLADRGALPVTFMLLPPQSWHPDVWTDVTRMRTLNATQAAKGAEQHLCPMQFDIAHRSIEQLSMPGETVYDPFAGLGTVPREAVLLGRVGRGTELATKYFLDSVNYCHAAERQRAVPTLFDLDAPSDRGAAE